MTCSDPNSQPLLPTQRELLEQFQVEQVVDIHNHCLPGLDDGPASMGDALELCRAFVGGGVTTVIATPHQLGRYDGRNSPEQVRRSVEALNEQLREEAIPLNVVGGGDVRIDERVLQLLESDDISTLADDGKYLLLELPHDVFFDIGPVIQIMRSRGVVPILSHPERHGGLVRNLDILGRWIDVGAVLQVTAGSLIGEFGREAHTAGWELIARGQVALVASDAHDTRRRPPRLSQAIELLGSQIGMDRTRLMCIDNPLRVLRGEV